MGFKTKVIIIFSLLIFSVACVAFSAYAVFTAESKTPKNLPPTPVYYTLTVYEDKLAVYCSEQKEPLRVFEVAVNTLPQRDITALENGITAGSMAEIMQILEDYE